MINSTKLFYLDTNCLIHARHYLACKANNIAEAHYPQGVRTGRTVVEALEECRNKNQYVLVVTSTLSKFEINQRYRKWIAKNTFLKLNVPIETIDGRERDVFGSLASLPPTTKSEFESEIKDSVNWLYGWEYKDIVTVQFPKPQIFEIADPMQFWQHRISLQDSLQLAIALSIGANYFVSGDGDLLGFTTDIHKQLIENNQLPDGTAYDPQLEPISPKTFLDKVSSLRM